MSARQETQQLQLQLRKAERALAKVDAAQSSLERNRNMLAQASQAEERLQLELSSAQEKNRAIEAERHAESEIHVAKLKSIRLELTKSQDAQATTVSALRTTQFDLTQTKNELSETRLSLNKEARSCLQAVEAKARLLTRVKTLEIDVKELVQKLSLIHI